MQRQTVIRSVPQWHAKIRVYFGHQDTAVCVKHVFNIGPPNQPFCVGYVLPTERVKGEL